MKKASVFLHLLVRMAWFSLYCFLCLHADSLEHRWFEHGADGFDEPNHPRGDVVFVKKAGYNLRVPDSCQVSWPKVLSGSTLWWCCGAVFSDGGGTVGEARDRSSRRSHCDAARAAPTQIKSQ